MADECNSKGVFEETMTERLFCCAKPEIAWKFYDRQRG